MDSTGIGAGVEEELFLTYLNQAHYELYNYTAALNEDLILNEELQTQVNNNEVNIANKFTCINSIYVDEFITPLKQLTLSKFIDYKKRNGVGHPSVFNARGTTISIYPIVQDTQYDLDVWYVPQPTTLTSATLESDIPYPLSFHNILSDGALYYMFQSEGGFKNSEKSRDHMAKWEKGKALLYSYLFHNTGEVVSTHSNAL